MGKRVDPFARAKSARASSDWLNECSRMLSLTRLDRVDPAGGAKVFTVFIRLTALGAY